MQAPAPAISLYVKANGPNAMPVRALVERAERAVEQIKQDYLPFLRDTLPNLEALTALAAAALVEDPWHDLKLAVLDVRSSSATAGYDQLSAVATSLEWLLGEAPARDPRIVEVVQLHLDAIWRLIEEGTPRLGSPKVQALLAALGRVTDHVTRGA
ncbi:MAG TPA: hypothetical protein VKZ79_01345 [Alphaproteobacteria bacterium]|nr:hypothetical protein [Alphaproteobacteria bacterium]